MSFLAPTAGGPAPFGPAFPFLGHPAQAAYDEQVLLALHRQRREQAVQERLNELDQYKNELAHRKTEAMVRMGIGYGENGMGD